MSCYSWMIKADRYYLDNLWALRYAGSVDKNPRAKYADGTPAHSKFITQVFEEYNIDKGEFPIPTLRNTAIKTGINEILWIYQKASSSLQDAHDLGIHWWDSFDIGDGTIGNRYGYTVYTHNLMTDLLRGLTNDPYGRRHIMNLYQNVDLKSSKGLYPCCYETLWSVQDEYLNMHLNIRSNDYVVAGFINRIQYVALQMMVAEHVGLKCGKFTCFVNNLHYYLRHEEAVSEILHRKPHNVQPKLTILPLSRGKNFYDFTVDDFEILNNVGEKLISPLELAI